MKRNFSLILAAMILGGVFFACGESASADSVEEFFSEYKSNVFIGRVIEVTSTSILVAPFNDEPEYEVADRISVNTGSITDDQSVYTLMFLEIGSNIQIEYDGIISEGNPPQINGVTGIRILFSTVRGISYHYLRARRIETDYEEDGKVTVISDDPQKDTVYCITSSIIGSSPIDKIRSFSTEDEFLVVYYIITDSEPPEIDASDVVELN